MKKAQIVNILEDELEDLDVEYDGSDETVRLPFRGFEIKTVKLKL